MRHIDQNHPLPIHPCPAITAAMRTPSREGEPQYLNRAFSAPSICTVEAGYLASQSPAIQMYWSHTRYFKLRWTKKSGQVPAFEEKEERKDADRTDEVLIDEISPEEYGGDSVDQPVELGLKRSAKKSHIGSAFAAVNKACFGISTCPLEPLSQLVRPDDIVELGVVVCRIHQMVEVLTTEMSKVHFPFPNPSCKLAHRGKRRGVEQAQVHVLVSSGFCDLLQRFRPTRLAPAGQDHPSPTSSKVQSDELPDP
ncbi:hypothetical protein DNTS_003857 [Danionella cerebrum]|uniref:Uncharacterized protein n=1 Tax=Danionella cerebrum TaxID=2873325 RepID=A0A553QYV6_9TELE|nr:hypothetical protein DNTS_003857 [Danionella translucida]